MMALSSARLDEIADEEAYNFRNVHHTDVAVSTMGPTVLRLLRGLSSLFGCVSIRRPSSVVAAGAEDGCGACWIVCGSRQRLLLLGLDATGREYDCGELRVVHLRKGPAARAAAIAMTVIVVVAVAIRYLCVPWVQCWGSEDNDNRHCPTTGSKAAVLGVMMSMLVLSCVATWGALAAVLRGGGLAAYPGCAPGDLDDVGDDGDGERLLVAPSTDDGVSTHTMVGMSPSAAAKSNRFVTHIPAVWGDAMPDGPKVAVWTRPCRTCKVKKVPRVAHCRRCNACVPVFHHHCGVLDVCVGQANRRPFILMVLALDLLALIMFPFSIAAFLALPGSLSGGSSEHAAMALLVVAMLNSLPLTVGACALVNWNLRLGVTWREARKRGGLYRGRELAERWARTDGRDVEDEDAVPRPFHAGFLKNTKWLLFG